MKRIALFCLTALVAFSNADFALAEVTDSTGIHYYTKDATVYVFEDQANLRAMPGIDAPIITKLPIDTKLTILADASTWGEDNTYTQNNMELPWIQVSLPLSPKKTIGYVWAGNLAKTAISADLGRDGQMERILTGFTAKTPSESMPGKYTVEMRVLRAGKQIASHNFEMTYTEANGLETTLYQPSGFAPTIDILKQDFLPEACAVTGGEMLFAWHSDHWVPVLNESYSSDAGAFSNYANIIFPAEKGGRKNTIRVKRISEYDWDDRIHGYKKRDTSWSSYTWNGVAFNKAKY